MRSLIIVLTSFINQVLKIIRFKEGEVDFSKERLRLCYSDITEDNFLITETGQICVIDFEDAALLPTSFMSFVLHGGSKPLAEAISNKVSLSVSANLSAMGMASYNFKICSNPRLGKSASAAVYITGC
jgi:serine/threonine protein kinase